MGRCQVAVVAQELVDSSLFSGWLNGSPVGRVRRSIRRGIATVSVSVIEQASSSPSARPLPSPPLANPRLARASRVYAPQGSRRTLCSAQDCIRHNRVRAEFQRVLALHCVGGTVVPLCDVVDRNTSKYETWIKHESAAHSELCTHIPRTAMASSGAAMIGMQSKNRQT